MSARREKFLDSLILLEPQEDNFPSVLENVNYDSMCVDGVPMNIKMMNTGEHTAYIQSSFAILSKVFSL